MLVRILCDAEKGETSPVRVDSCPGVEFDPGKTCECPGVILAFYA